MPEELENRDLKGAAGQRKSGEGEAGAPVAPGLRPRPDLEALRARRARRVRRVRRFFIAFGVLALLFLGLWILDWQLFRYYQDRYTTQAWIEIFRMYGEIEKGKVLDIHKEKVLEELEAEYLGKDVYVIGRVTGVKRGAASVDPGLSPGAEVLIDVPHFLEDVNFYGDDVHLEMEAPLASGVTEHKWVWARGRVKNFSMYRLRLKGSSIRPLTFVERYYLKKVLPPTRLTREPIGFDRYLK